MRVIYLAVGLVLFTGGCRTSATIGGSGTVATQPRSVTEFTEIAISGPGHLSIQQSNAESLTVTADDNLLTYLTSDVQAGKLQLGVRPGVRIRPSRDVLYRATVRNLRAIVVSGSAVVAATGINSRRLETTISGSGEVDASGIADTQQITISGSGRFNGEDLRSIVVTISVSGSGSAVLAVSDRLDATISGSGSIEYIGNPTITQRITGSGTIRRR